MTGIFDRISNWFNFKRDPYKRPAIYGRASTIEGRRTPIKAENRETYEESARKLVEAANKGRRR